MPKFYIPFLFFFFCLHLLYSQTDSIDFAVFLPNGQELDKGAYVLHGTVCADGRVTYRPVISNWGLDGVNVLDLLLIQKHLLGTQPLTSPYKMIAADVNKSGSITPTDIIELRKLILGIYPTVLPANDSWRFIDQTYVFTNPNNPFDDLIIPPSGSTLPPYFAAETKTITNYPGIADFWAIKTGDLDYGAVTGCQEFSLRPFSTLLFSVEKSEEKNKSTKRFHIKNNQDFKAAAWQFSFDLGRSGVQVKNVLFPFPNNGVNTGWHVTEENELRIIYFDTNDGIAPTLFEKEAMLFEVEYEGMDLSQNIALSEKSDFQSLVFDESGGNYAISFAPTTERKNVEQDLGIETLVFPNPGNGAPSLQIESPIAFEGWYRVCDLKGSVLGSWWVEVEGGGTTLLKKSKMNRLPAGEYYLMLESPKGNIIRPWTKL